MLIRVVTTLLAVAAALVGSVHAQTTDDNECGRRGAFAPVVIADDELRAEARARGWFAPEELTDDELRAEGRARAEADYASGWAEIEQFGLRLGAINVDTETGLYVRECGCVIMNKAKIESDAYNGRIRELAAQNPPPAKARGLKERFLGVRQLIDQDVQFSWTSVSWPKPDAKNVPTPVGPFHVVAEVVPNPAGAAMVRRMQEIGVDFPAEVERVRINRGESVVATVRAREGQEIVVTFVAEFDVLIVKKPGRHASPLSVVDLVHGRVMLRTFGLRQILKQFKKIDETQAKEPPDLI